MACRLLGANPLSKPKWPLIDHTLRNRLQWKNHPNLVIFIDEIELKTIVCNFATNLSTVKWAKVTNLFMQQNLPSDIKHIVCVYFCRYGTPWRRLGNVQLHSFGREQKVTYTVGKFKCHWLTHLHPCSKVIGIFFAMSKRKCLNSKYRCAILRVV